jgi:hypothetical protein
MNGNSRKFNFKINKKRLIIPVLVVLTLAAWPAHLTKSDAAVLAGVSPLAITMRNLWGAPKGETVDVTLYRSDSALGWNWSRENPLPYTGVNYVEPIYPNAQIALTTPVTIGKIKSLNLFSDFHYNQTPTGNYSLVYDVFLREPGTKAHKMELMVVLDRTQPQGEATFKGIYSDGNNTYKLYSWMTADGCAFRSFHLNVPPATAPYQVNLKALIDQVKPDKDWYISEVELGTEVWNGAGAVELTGFYLELNGERL